MSRLNYEKAMKLAASFMGKKEYHRFDERTYPEQIFAHDDFWRIVIASLEKAKHYEDLEEQGRLIELPCKVGDTVWIVGTKCLADHQPEIWCEYHDCDKCIYDKEYTVFDRKIDVLLACKMALNIHSNFVWGKTAFATEAEAEEALKRIQDNRLKLAEMKEGEL